MGFFNTRKVIYDYGACYDIDTGEKIETVKSSIYFVTSYAWITTFQETLDDVKKITRIIFVEN